MDYNNFYGDAKEQTTSSTGEVAGYCMSSYSLNDKGSLEIHFTKTFESGKSITLKQWFNEVDPEQVKVWEGKTKEECVEAEVQRFNRFIKNLICNYVEVAEYESAMKRVNSFTSLVEVTKNLLPDNYSEIEGRLVVGYNAKGFLTCPNRMSWNKATSRFEPFFTVNSSVKLCPLPTNLSLTKPVPQAELAEADVDDDF